MSTVTKPIVLDETAKLIKGTLEEIRDAITGSETAHYPVRIQVATPPEKVDYIVGDTLDLTGIVVNAIFDNNVPYDITDDCSFSPADGSVLTETDTAINVSWTWAVGAASQTFHTKRAINVSGVQSITVTTPPTKNEYFIGDSLDLTGIVVKANTESGGQVDVTDKCEFTPSNGATLTASDEAVIATYTLDGNTYTASTPITIAVCYGVEWDGLSGSAMTRTDWAADFIDPVPAVNNGNGSSPFDNILPWSGMEKITDADGGDLVKIPKYWYKWTRNGASMKLQISNTEQEGFLVSPAHADRGDGNGERDYVYVGAYHCAESTYKSTSGVLPQANMRASGFRTSIHNLSSEIWQYDFAMYWTIAMLYLVEYADWNSQAKIGYGCGNDSTPDNSGMCDLMVYHTGTNAVNRTTYGHTRYRYIEDLWGNVLDIVAGIYVVNDEELYCIKNPADFSESAGGTYIGSKPLIDKDIKEWAIPSATGFEYALYPSDGVSDPSYSSYVCDKFSWGGEGVCISVGAFYSQSQSYGLFYSDSRLEASSTLSAYGSRLMKLPNAS